MNLPSRFRRLSQTLMVINASLAVSGSDAGQLGHFTPGVTGLRDYFQPAEPGFYYSQVNFMYSSDEFRDGDGDTLDSLTLTRSLDLTRTFAGSRSFGFTKGRSSSFTFDYQGSSLDLGARVDTATTATADISLSAEARARLRGQATVRARLDDLDVRISGILPTIVWKSEWKVLGAGLGASMTLPLVNLDIEAQVSGTADVRARLDALVTARAAASLTASATADGELSIGGPRGSVFHKGGQRTASRTATRSKTVTRTFSREARARRDFKLSISESVTDVGDLYVQPLWLDWSGKHYEVALSDGFFAPTGRYNPGALDNTGFGMWTNQARLAAAWYPGKTKATVVSAALTYEVHGEKEGLDITPGQNLTVNWGVGQMLPLGKDQTLLADIAIVGYDQFQVTDDRGGGVTYDAGVHDEVHAVGLALGLVHTRLKGGLTLRWMHEYSARDRFQGDMFVLSFSKKL
jgi:hypothetical protein